MATHGLALVRDIQETEVAAPDNVLVHVRFYSNGVISSIGEKPQALDDREWFERLLTQAPEYYQVLAGGRGFFRIPRPRFDAILAA